jgi:hypothetical protein
MDRTLSIQKSGASFKDLYHLETVEGSFPYISADMFESVNKKTVVHPLFKVGFSISKRLPEEARLNSDG